MRARWVTCKLQFEQRSLHPDLRCGCLPSVIPPVIILSSQIASHGPYKKVKDVYAMAGLTKEQASLFKKYEGEFTVNPPGRLFIERVNARQSL